MNVVRLHWDGEQLHAQAHDGNHMAWSRWHPDDPTDEDAQESFLEPWGSDDDPGTVVVSLDDAKALAKAYKPDKKRLFVPLALDLADGLLRVRRDKVPGLMG